MYGTQSALLENTWTIFWLDISNLLYFIAEHDILQMRAFKERTLPHCLKALWSDESRYGSVAERPTANVFQTGIVWKLD